MTTPQKDSKTSDSRPPNSNETKAREAVSAMKDLGISYEVVKPVLRKLLKLYDGNWELIEEDNYRTLADAIFESIDDKVYLSFHTPVYFCLMFFHYLDQYFLMLAFNILCHRSVTYSGCLL